MAVTRPACVALRIGASVEIRAAEPGEASATLALYRSTVEEGRYTLVEVDEFAADTNEEAGDIQAYRDNPGALWLVAEVDGVLVGNARVKAGSLRRTAHCAELDCVWVDAAWRRSGIADALMSELVRWAQSSPTIEKLGMFVFSTRAAAQELSARHGFVEEGRGLRDMKVGSDRYIDTIIMGRLLS